MILIWLKNVEFLVSDFNKRELSPEEQKQLAEIEKIYEQLEEIDRQSNLDGIDEIEKNKIKVEVFITLFLFYSEENFFFWYTNSR